MIARAGKTLGGQAVVTSSRASATILPQVGISVETPKPRKLKVGGGPQQTAARAARAAGLPGEAQLMDCQPDEQIVEPAERPPAHAQRQQVHERGGRGQRPEGGEAVALPGAVGQGREQDHQNVDDQEPGGQQRELGGNLQQRGIGVELERGEADERPGREHGQNRADEAPESSGQPGGIAVLAALGGLPAKPVDIAADEEEERHHLEEPGQPAGSGDEGERVGGHQLAVLEVGGDQQPVAEDDHADGGGAQKIDVAVALRRGLFGQAGGMRPVEEVYGDLLWEAVERGESRAMVSTAGRRAMEAG